MSTKNKNVRRELIDGYYDLGTIYKCDQKAPVKIFEELEIDLNKFF